MGSSGRSAAFHFPAFFVRLSPGWKRAKLIFLSHTQPAAIDVDYALWLFHKAMSLGAITVEWKSTCRLFGILFGFQTLFLLASCASPFFLARDFAVLSIPGTNNNPRKKIFNSYTNSKRSLTTPQCSGRARQAFWRTFVYFYIHIIYGAFLLYER